MNFAPFLNAFVAVTLLMVAAAAGLFASSGADMPGPHLSTSYSFNAKAIWLRQALAGRRCDVLVIGSSMSLNGVDAGQLAGPGERVINLSSWGLNPEDLLPLLKIVLPLCHPKRVVMATYHGDFANQPAADKTIDWALVGEYLSGGSELHAYLAHIDLYELLEHSLFVDDRHSRAIYESVAFDRTGSVAFACGAEFHRTTERWDGDLADTVGLPRPAALAAMSTIARMVHDVGAGFLVAVMPLRPRADRGLSPVERAAMWQAVAARVRAQRGNFIVPVGNSTFTDAEFADYAHLNGCGAKRWTGMVLRAEQNLR